MANGSPYPPYFYGNQGGQQNTQPPQNQQASLANVYGGSSQQPMIPGRVVQNEEEIKPNEVPMDLTIALFPKSDYSCIYARQWNRNGTIEPVKYVPEAPKPATAQTPSEDGLNKVLERLNDIEELLKRKPHYNKPKNQNKEDKT